MENPAKDTKPESSEKFKPSITGQHYQEAAFDSNSHSSYSS